VTQVELYFAQCPLYTFVARPLALAQVSDMIAAVAFDLDDTLYDEIDYCRSGLLSVSRFLVRLSDIPCADDAFACLWKHFTSGNRTRTFNAALDDLGIAYDGHLITQLVEVYRNHRPAIKLPSESRVVLDQLGGTRRLGLLTDGFMPAQRLKVQALGIEGCFRAIVYTEELGRQFWKPSPVGFQKLVERLDVRAEQTAYIADNESKDFIAPNRLGMLTIQLLRPARLHTDVCPQCGAAAKLRIDHLSELPAALSSA
jgi:putative hydrolase of the HAD superfamily